MIVQQLPGRRPADSIVLVAKAVYLLHALSIFVGVAAGASIIGAFLFGWPSILAVVLNYCMRSEARDTYVESHFEWQIRTFWYAMAWSVLVALTGFALSFVLVGFAVWTFGFIVMGIWVGYRIVRGWIDLAAERTVPM